MIFWCCLIFLAGWLSLARRNARHFLTGPVRVFSLAAFFRSDADPGLQKEIAERIRTMPGVRSVELVSAQKSLELFAREPAWKEALQRFSDSPLPAWLSIRTDSDPKGIAAMLKKMPQVEEVRFPGSALERAAFLQRILDQAFLAAAGALVVLAAAGVWWSRGSPACWEAAAGGAVGMAALLALQRLWLEPKFGVSLEGLQIPEALAPLLLTGLSWLAGRLRAAPPLALACVLLAGAGPGSASDYEKLAEEYARKSQQTRKEISRLELQSREIRREQEEAQRKQKIYEARLEEATRRMIQARASSRKLSGDIRRARREIRDLEEKKVRLEKGLAALEMLLARIVRRAYMEQHGLPEGDLALFSPEETFRSQASLSNLRRLADQGRFLMVQQDRLRAQLETRLEQERSARANLEDLLAEQKEEERKTRLWQEELQSLLTQTHQKQRYYEEQTRKLQETQKSLEHLLSALARKQAQALEMAARQRARRKPGQLAWPVEGRLLHRFGRQPHSELQTVVIYNGIRIGAEAGENVRASLAGRVIFAEHFRSFGNMVILDHGGDLMTLYGNLEKILVVPDQEVVSGETIGTAGIAPEFGASCVYFEVRRKGEAQDPLVWLAARPASR